MPAFLICLYYWFLALYAFSHKFKKDLIKLKPDHTFAIVIPAHNEETVLHKTIESCLKLNYPKDRFKIFVIADNCTDATALVAEKYDVTCYVRNDISKIGKGFALSYAFERILTKAYEGIVVIDADCIIESHALLEFSKYFRNGHKVLQANDSASNPDDSPMSYAVAVGNYIENDLFYAPKSSIGLSVFLRGTGMVLHHTILNLFQWKAFSIVEDVEYSLNLLRNNIRINFIQNVKVSSPFPVTKEQLTIQRSRWASGNLSFGKQNAAKLMFEGINKKNLQIFDAGVTLLILSRPLIITYIGVSLILFAINAYFQMSVFSLSLLFISIAITLSLILYFFIGILGMGITYHRIKLLCQTPFVVLRLISISIINLFGWKIFHWQKTPRKN